MNAFDHANFCRTLVKELYQIYNKGNTGKKVSPEFTYAFYDDENKVYCYIHPEDKEARYIKDFKYEYREI